MADGGKALRVIGFFLLLFGAGVILDSSADVFGALIAACGAAAFLWGFTGLTARERRLSDSTTRGPERC
jgi:hypothetical protein